MSTHEMIVQLLYLGASILFIMGLQAMNKAESARRGIRMAEVGMLLAVIGTLLHKEIVSYQWILISIVIGSAIGTAMGLFIPMVKMPERIALSHAFGGRAVGLVGVFVYLRQGEWISTLLLGATA
jgi:NAD(P) transhydrogenase subunit beta